ncbi:hypothetical protein ABFS83_10G090200 [Erythranthe nasuta]
MERGKATPAAAVEEDDRMETCEEVGGGQMVAFELEAAAALAGLARSSGGAVGSGEMERRFPPAAVDTSTQNPKDQSVGTENMRDSYVSTSAITVSERSDRKIVENTASQLCSTSCQSTKLRPKLTEAEKQARKLHRVLANRESARQTIRRRQALYLELAGKAAYLSEENESLKKEKEVAAKEYNSLKDRNEVLKAELAKLKKAEQLRGPQEDPNTSSSSRPDESSSATSIYLHNRPSVVPCFWPSLFPSSDILQSQCGPPLSYDTSSSQGQEKSMGAPLLLFPVPFLLPFQTPNEGKNTENQSSICSCSVARLNEDNNNNNNNNNNNSQVDDTSNANANDVSAPESATRAGSAEENREPVVSPREDSDDAIAATIARRRRKELMKMRNKHCYQQQQQHTR